MTISHHRLALYVAMAGFVVSALAVAFAFEAACRPTAVPVPVPVPVRAAKKRGKRT